jgi:polyisoprenoid-binding protein YceI
MTEPRLNDPDLSTLTGAWVLDPSRSTVVFHTKAMWVLKVTGTAKVLSGQGNVTADGAVSGTLVVDAASIDTKTAKRDVHLRTADFFEVDKYPTFTYTATGAHQTDAGVQISGTLSLHGQTHPLDLLAHVSTEGDAVTVTSEVAIDRSTWGLNWTKMGASVHNRVEITAYFRSLGADQ